MGCSTYWKTVQSIAEPLRPSGPNDLLQYEADHIETFMGSITMHGSFQPQQRESLGCDVANTLYYAEDPKNMVLWGFIAPSELYKLTENDVLGFAFFDQTTFVDPDYLIQRGVKMYFVEQKIGQTVFIPSGWVYWNISYGSGLLFSASWNILRLRNIVESRKMVEMNRELGIYKPINISSIVYHYTLLKMDEFLYSADESHRVYLQQCLQHILPVLQTIVLEELLGERINISSLVALTYDFVSNLKKSRTEIPADLQEQILHAGGTDNLWNKEDNAIPIAACNDSEDLTVTCESCKTIIFNTRRACKLCPRGFDVCEHCFPLVGKDHPHTMERIKKIETFELMNTMDQLYTILYSGKRDITSQFLNQTYTTGGGNPSAQTFFPISSLGHNSNNNSNNNNNSNSGNNTIPPNHHPAPLPSLRSPPSEPFDHPREPRSTRQKREPKEAYPEPSSPYEEDEIIDCICGNNKDLGFMISCEKCLAWLHGKCVGISKRNEPEKYFCPRCEKKRKLELDLKATALPSRVKPNRN